ncbi:MscL family protein [Humisphaera borealis]
MPTISYATTAVKDAKNAAVDAAAKASDAVGLTATTQPATQPATKPSSVPSTQPAPASAEAPAVPTTQEAQAGAVADKMIADSGGKSKEWKEMVSAFATALEADRKAADAKAAIAKAEADKKAAEEKPVDLSWKIGRINVGNFIAAIVNFVIIAAAVFIIMVKILGGVMKKTAGTPKAEEPTSKECPECLSIIPIKAKRCPNCTSILAPNATPTV